MNDYHCRKCHRWMFASDATYGRLVVVCPHKDCRERQLVFLGGHQPAETTPERNTAILLPSG